MVRTPRALNVAPIRDLGLNGPGRGRCGRGAYDGDEGCSDGTAGRHGRVFNIRALSSPTLAAAATLNQPDTSAELAALTPALLARLCSAMLTGPATPSANCEPENGGRADYAESAYSRSRCAHKRNDRRIRAPRHKRRSVRPGDRKRQTQSAPKRRQLQ